MPPAAPRAAIHGGGGASHLGLLPCSRGRLIQEADVTFSAVQGYGVGLLRRMLPMGLATEGLYVWCERNMELMGLIF